VPSGMGVVGGGKKEGMAKKMEKDYLERGEEVLSALVRRKPPTEKRKKKREKGRIGDLAPNVGSVLLGGALSCRGKPSPTQRPQKGGGGQKSNGLQRK